MHLRPSGKPETLKVRLGLYLTDTPPTKSCFRLGLSSLMIDIPPGEQSYTVEDQFELPEDSQVLGVLPHAHYLCKRMEGFAILPDGTQKWLVLIKNWDFNWQGVYHYDKPMMLPKGTRLAMRFTYDNSTNNIQNPNTPPRRVRYGPQSSDEMGELWFQLLPLKPEGVGLLADAQAAKSRADVINYYEFVLQHDPNDVQAHTKLGFIRFLQGNSDEGIAHLRKAIALDPQADMPHYKLGLVFRNQNRFAEAKAEFEAALKLNPRNCDAHANVGVIYAAEGNLQLAEEHLRAAVNINPNDPNARALLSELLKAKANR
jgi:tetratricopeptide (TPR) repeat protein